MHAIMLAAGRGIRLSNGAGHPKCLLEFGGKTLLRLHIAILESLGIDKMTIVVGFKADEIHAELAAIGAKSWIDTIFNPRFDEGAVVSLWAALQALRKKDSLFTLAERKMIWFWCGLGLVCLLLAFGRFTPFYHLVQALPYFSSFRSPIRFLNPMFFSVSMIFGYGLSLLWRRYLTDPGSTPLANQPGNRWQRASRFALEFRAAVLARSVCRRGFFAEERRIVEFS